ncbi:MAG: alanine racemase [Oscillospiraceae bacterium]|nr:alanine racemase [Oscillospiraceae bacterium]MDY6208052.1 alanine racemase [Oscillospiraceae bacterium]
MKKFLSRAWAEVHLDRLKDNLTALRSLIDENTTQIACVVKANAYGHDDGNIAPYLESLGVSFFAVSNIKEAENLRRNGVKGEILILGHTPAEYAPELAEYDIIQAAVSLEYARELSECALQANVRVKIHMAVDTGMGRIGVCASDDESLAAAAMDICSAASLRGIILDGTFSHYAAADSLDDDDIAYTAAQTERFFDVCGRVRSQGISLRHTHCLNSAGGAYRFDSRSTLVRFGIMLYGLKPDRSLVLPVKLTPVMDLKAAVSYVKPVKAGSFISYGRTYRADKDIIAATIPIGYADGYSRSLSGKGYVLINGRKAPIIGRICMDQLMADVTDIKGVREGTEVTLMGTEGSETITADDLAGLCGTIGYEIICGISKRIPRVIYRDGEISDVVEYY